MKALAIGLSLLFVAGLCLAADWAAAAGSPAPPQPTTPLERGILSVGSISRLPKKEVATFQPFADYLARRLDVTGITQGRVVVAASMPEMADLMKRREVDLYIDSPFPVTVVSMRSGARPFLRRWKRNRAEYHTLFFVRKDSGIESVRDLRGKMVAFDEPTSTSGYLLPKATLLKAGLTVRRHTDPSARVAAGEIGYIFANDEENIVFWVLRGKIPAGAMSNEHFDRLVKDRRDELKILLRTIDVPRQVVAHRADMPTRVLIALEEALLSMHLQDEGRRVLEGFDKTTKFDRFPQSVGETFRPIEELTRLVESEVKE